MTDITVSRELLRQAIDALNEADNVLTSSMFAESADSLRAALDAEPAPEAKPEKLNPLTQLQVAYVMGLRDANSAPQPAPVQEQQPAPASKPVLLQCLGCERVGTQEQLSASTDCDCWLHTQPAPVQEPVTWNQVQVCTWIGNQLMTQPSMFERNAVCKFVRSLGRNEKLASIFQHHKHNPLDQAPCASCVQGGNVSDNFELKVST